MIRKALVKNIEKISDLLLQVDSVHHNGRPDILKIGKKYNKNQLKEILKDENRPVLVSVNESDNVQG